MFRKNLEGRVRSFESSEAVLMRPAAHKVSLVSFFAAALLAFVLLLVPSQFAHADETTIDGVKYTYTADQSAHHHWHDEQQSCGEGARSDQRKARGEDRCS